MFEHVDKTHKTEQRKCQEFNSAPLLDSHISHYKIKHGICDFRSVSKQKLWKHVSKVHEMKKCHVCSSKLDSKFQLHSHIVIVHKRKCEICGLSFISKAQLFEHVDKTHKTKQRKCHELNSRPLLDSHSSHCKIKHGICKFQVRF